MHSKEWSGQTLKMCVCVKLMYLHIFVSAGCGNMSQTTRKELKTMCLHSNYVYGTVNQCGMKTRRCATLLMHMAQKSNDIAVADN